MLPILLKTSWLTLYSYPFMMGIAWVVAYRLTLALLEKYQQSHLVLISNTKFNFWYLGLVISSFIGAKIAFLLFSSGNLFDSHTGQLSFWFGGGFVFYGGMLGAGLWSWFAIPRNLYHFFIPGAALSHGIGRIGCFLAGCCYGHNHFPIQLVESSGLLIFAFWSLRKIRFHKLTEAYFLFYSIFRFSLEFFRADEIRGVWGWSLSTSQIISLIILTSVLIYHKITLIYKNSV